MSWLSVLRAILGWLLYIAVLCLLISPVSIYMFISDYIFGDNDWAVNATKEQQATSVVLVFILFLGYLSYVGMLYYLRKAAKNLNNRLIVNLELKEQLRKSGVLCIIATLATRIPMIYLKRPFQTRQIDSVDLFLEMFEYGPSSALVLVALGIFLIILSRIIAQNIAPQEEVKYTV